MAADMNTTSLTHIATTFHDPFWHPPLATQARPPTPVTHRQAIKTLTTMAYVQPHTQYARRTLQCTHMTMLRVYGDHACHVCDKIPEHGYIYVCCQDLNQAKHKLPGQHIVELSKLVETQSVEAKALMAEALGMSHSVVEHIRKAYYTEEEIKLLFSQRRHVVDILRKIHEGEFHKVSDIGSPLSASDPATIPAPSTKQSKDVDPSSKAITVKSPPCYLQVCRSCKPYLRDRCFSHPSTILEDAPDRWTDDDLALLPIHNASVLRGMVMPGEARPNQQNTCHSQDGPSMSSFTPTSSSDYSDTSSDSDHFPFKFSGQHLRSGRERIEDMNDFSIRDMTNTPREELVHSADQTTPFKFRSHSHATPDLTESPMSASTNSPADLTSSPLTPLRQMEEPFEASFEKKVGTFAKSASFCGPFRPQDSPQQCPISRKTSWDKSIRADGSLVGKGIALTEESVEIGVPDIITI
ncbi:hypothetical protein AMS68_000203 [Peltaster fructicola]|uniref:Uncharacterized protein n=1 Tax=Peltaster fructicola TaxID=286661 RepID=A0A6H0XIZ2_9PEZI|nr:hypothetical protein AMS68_000203 [Peltaster fructicola]